MPLEDYLQKREASESTKYKTANLDHELHSYLKRTAAFYNISLSELLNNIIDGWKEQYNEQIKNDFSEGNW